MNRLSRDSWLGAQAYLASQGTKGLVTAVMDEFANGFGVSGVDFHRD
ncbi:hypothetical protein [Synechococcus sp. UW140]|nr:hypothetical protein [Synechococcus sp. UW140]